LTYQRNETPEPMAAEPCSSDRVAFDEWADKRGLFLSDRWIYWEGWKEGVKREREACAKAIESAGPKDGALSLVTKGFADVIRARG